MCSTRAAAVCGDRSDDPMAKDNKGIVIKHSFEYDERKSAVNLSKHGIDFVEAQRLWDDDFSYETQLATGALEQRYATIGGIGYKHWTAIITYRDERISLISVRRARSNEIKLYEVAKHERQEKTKRLS